jgi:SPP1 family predicted phage head-tail adaptor
MTMYFSDKIELIAITVTENSMGDMIETETKTEVFANRKSIRQSEFYQAAATGLRPEIMFEVWSEEYSSQQRVKYDNKLYTIIRTYDKGERTELVCQGVVNN